MTRRKIRWYGIKTLFRLVAVGKPQSPDKDFDPTATLVEEGIVLFRACDFDDAIKQALKEAQAYCKRIRYKNIYGQKVHLRFLDAWDAIEILDNAPDAGSEVYSSTQLVSDSVPDSRIVKNRLGKKEKNESQVRYKFINGTILSRALTSIKADSVTGARPTMKRKP